MFSLIEYVFFEINVDLRFLTGQSKSFQVVWGCESLGAKRWYSGRDKKHKAKVPT